MPATKPIDKDRSGAPYAAGELLVTYKPGTPAPVKDDIPRQAKAKVDKDLPKLNTKVLSLPEVKNQRGQRDRERLLEQQKQALKRNPAVEAVDYNYLRKPTWTPNDTYFPQQWALPKIQAPQAWDITRGNGVKIAIVDTGIDATQPDLQGKIAAQHDFVNKDNVAEDNVGHGTHVAGIASAVTNNGKGVAGGCPDCKLIIAKALDTNGGFDSDVADAIVWSVDNGAKAVNLSLGGTQPSTVLENAVNYAWNKGAVVAAAAGNDGNTTNATTYPAAYANAMGVAATDQNDNRAAFSNYGSYVDVAAPGVSVLSTVKGGGYQYWDGTSMATPYVTALAGLLASEGLTASEIRKRIESTAVDRGSPGKDPYYGWGRINYLAAVQTAGTNTPSLLPLSVSSVTPSIGYPGTSVTLTINGAGFQNGVKVNLVRGSSTIAASWATVDTPTKVTAKFVLPANAIPGKWDVQVTNPDNKTATLPQAFGLMGTYQDNDASHMKYGAWAFNGYNPGYSGGFRAFSNVGGAGTSLWFKGSDITWKTAKLSDSGKTAVYLDGKLVTVFDGYSATAQYDVTGFSRSNLPYGWHNIRLSVTGAKNPSSKGTYTDLDRFISGGTSYQEWYAPITYGAWSGAFNSNALGAAYRYTSVANNPMTFAQFTGPKVDIVTAAGPNQGKLSLRVRDAADNSILSTVTWNMYSPTQQWKVVRTLGGLDPKKAYYLEVFSADGKQVVVDAIKAVPQETLTPFGSGSR